MNSGKLLRISTFTSSGTWVKKDDIGFVVVEVVGGGGNGGGPSAPHRTNLGGGGGGGYSKKRIESSLLDSTTTVTVGGAGGTSSFGSHCQATGGGSPASTSGFPVGSGGVGSGGDINLQGQNGSFGANIGTDGTIAGAGGSSPYCHGGGTPSSSHSRNGVPNTGGGGAGMSTAPTTYIQYSAGDGASGIVIIHEYSK